MEATLCQQWVPSEPRVYLSDQFNYGLHALWVRIAGVQQPVSEVFIDVPHALAVALGSRAQQRRTVCAQSYRREPARRNQLIPPGNARFQALDYERANAAVDLKVQAIHARFQPMLIEHPACS